ncbi:unnamed protein product [Calypogeia fissa]
MQEDQEEEIKKKVVYDGNRRFLPMGNELRLRKGGASGQPEDRPPPERTSSTQWKELAKQREDWQAKYKYRGKEKEAGTPYPAQESAMGSSFEEGDDKQTPGPIQESAVGIRFEEGGSRGEEQHTAHPVQESQGASSVEGNKKEGRKKRPPDPVLKSEVKNLSLLFKKLPYCDQLLIRHVVDPMHTFSNIATVILETLGGLTDTDNVRRDLEVLNIRKDL